MFVCVRRGWKGEGEKEVGRREGDRGRRRERERLREQERFRERRECVWCGTLSLVTLIKFSIMEQHSEPQLC